MVRALKRLLTLAAVICSASAMAYYDDVHYGLTYLVARRTGYTALQAHRIASAALQIDYDPDTEPVQMLNQVFLTLTPLDGAAQAPRWRWHAMRDERRFPDSVGRGPGAAEADLDLHGVRDENWKSAVEVLRNPGPFLHALQDEDPHRGYGTKWGHWPLDAGEFEAFLKSGVPIGGTTDWVSFRQSDVERVCGATAKRLELFMKAECPDQQVFPTEASQFAGVIQALARANPHPKPLTTDAQRRMYVAYKQSAFGAGTTSQSNPDIQNLAGQLGSALSAEDARKHDKGPDLQKAYVVINSELGKLGFKDRIPEANIKYDLNASGGVDWSQINDWTLSGHLRAKFKGDKQMLVTIRMPQDGPHPSYQIGPAVSVEPGDEKWFPDLPVGPLEMHVQAGQVHKTVTFTLKGKVNALPEVDLSSSSPPDPGAWTCAKPVLRGFTAIRDLAEDEFLPVFGASLGSVSYSDPDAKQSGGATWAGIPLSLKAGDKLDLSVTAKNMDIKLWALNATGGEGKTIRLNAIDPFTPPASSVSRSYVFTPDDGVDVVTFSVRASPMNTFKWGSCGVTATYQFRKGAAGGGSKSGGTEALDSEVLGYSVDDFARIDTRRRPTVEEIGGTGSGSVEVKQPTKQEEETTSVGAAFSPESWSAPAAGQMTREGQGVALSIPKDQSVEAKSFNPTPLSGDFAIEVAYSLKDWTPANDGLLKFNLYFARKPSGDDSAVVITRAAAPTNEAFMVFPSGEAPGSVRVAPETSGKLKITRDDGVWTVFRWMNSGWEVIHTFELKDTNAVYLGLGVSKRENGNPAKVGFEVTTSKPEAVKG